MLKMRKIALVLSLLCLVACGGGKKSAAERKCHPFPQITVPSVYTAPSEKLEYTVLHFWDEYFSRGGFTDSTAVLGVRLAEVEQQVANYVSLLDRVPMKLAKKGVGKLFDKIEAQQKKNEASLQYRVLTELVCRYLYDPNSPMRNEDYFLPFVSALVKSPFTPEELRPGYEFQERMCSINQYGEKVPNFKFKDIRGRNHSLYGVKAEYTMLFFSNPGCHSCKQIIEDVCSWPYTEEFIAGGRLAVVNVYIDKEIEEWKAYEHNYPRNWITGYDYKFEIREDNLYYVRAIPCLYLLDGNKRVIMRDAPTEKVMIYLDNIAKQ